MYTIYNVQRHQPNGGSVNSHDVVWFNQDGTVSSIWTGDGIHSDRFGLTECNFITKLIVRATCWSIVLFDELIS